MQFPGFCDDAENISIPGLSKEIKRRFKGGDFVVTLAKNSRKRSTSQNAWIWGVAYPLLADHLGYDHHEHERLHYDLLSVRFGTKAVAPLLPGAPPRIEPQRTSSELTTKEFSDYMDWLVRYAATEFGVVIPLPDDAMEAA